MKNVLIIGGGISDEREVSLKSSKCVFEAAKGTECKVEYFDWQGGWSWLDQNVGKFDAVLPILHGKGGEDGQIQAYLEAKGIPFLGAGSKASELCFFKDKTNKFLRDHDVLLPDSEVVDYESYKSSAIRSRPHVLKPVDGGSSIDTLIDIKHDEDSGKLNELFGRYEKLLLEEFITGIELTVPVLEGKDLPAIEIIPPKGGVFDFENKYNGSTQELCPPQNIDQLSQERAVSLGKRVHELVDCRHISRVDMILSGDKLYTLEVNTIPGLTDTSLFPKAAGKIGMDMTAFVEYLIELVLRK